MKPFFLFVICLSTLFQASCQSEKSPQIPPTKEIAESTPVSTNLPEPSPSEPVLPSPEITPQTQQKPQKPIILKAFCTIIGEEPIVYVPRGTPVIITWGWEAKTEEQVNAFLDSNLTSITLDGKLLNGTRQGEFIKNARSGQPEVVWISDVGVLNVGEHLITYDVKFKKLVEDGSSTYGPGGKTETLHDECRVIVR
jgi:hypothetical protein